MAGFDTFFMATLIPPVGVWSAIYGLSRLPFFNTDRRDFVRKLAIVSGAVCFGSLFAAFGFLSLEGIMRMLFIGIGFLVMFYSVVLYKSFD